MSSLLHRLSRPFALRRILFVPALTARALFAPMARFCLLLLTTGAVPAAVAAPVSFISGATAQVDANPPGNNNFSFVRDIGQQSAASATTSFSYNVGGTVESRASSQANLQAGTVKVGTSLTMTDQDDAFVAVATGFFGDGYQHFAGNDPFTWTGNTTARFDVRLTGNSSLTGNVRDLFNVGVMFLMIYPKDTLDDFVPFCGAFRSYFWSIGPSANRQTPCGGAFQDNFDGIVDDTVSLAFNHDGDFDWAFGIRVGGAVSANPNTTVTWLNDYLSTAELFYTPPAGVTSIRSRSGSVLAQGPDNQVPLPGTLALLSLGLAAMGVSTRRARPK
jgi:hypothetical protein